MVYKKYIKRGGKRFGPYYYESYRDKNGRVKTRFIKGPTKKDKIINNLNKLTNINKRPVKRAFVALSLIFLLFLSLAILSISAIKINNLYKNIAGFSVSNISGIINENQNLIKITDAEHLDSNRNLIENIFDDVKEFDNKWSKRINPNEFLRIKFEKNLTKKDDITIYARKSSLSGECYDNETEILTEEGWKYFYELNEIDKVATLNNQTGELKWQKPSDYSIFDNGNDDMYQINLEDRSGRESELVVSENHRVYANVQDSSEQNSLMNSSVVNTLTNDCCLRCGSFDQTGQFNLNANAIKSASFLCGIESALYKNSLYSSIGTNSTHIAMSLNNFLNSFLEISVFSNICSEFLLISSNDSSGAKKSKFW